jgi:hypothetical protein
VSRTWPGRWSQATAVQFGSKLLSAASEAGLITAKRDPRTPLYPKITDEALTYLLYLLRGVSFEGTIARNPYLVGVGLDPPALEQRVRTAAVSYRRLADVDDFDWAYGSLREWAEATG